MNRTGLLERFALHPVAMNILMFSLLALGLFSLSRINLQFFPTFAIPFVTVQTTWPEGSAEDVELSITNRLELDLKNIDNLKEVTSLSRAGSSSIFVEFKQGTDMGEATDDVKNIIDLAQGDLPNGAELPEVRLLRNYEPVARLVVTGASLDQLRVLAHQFKDELVARGIGKIDVIGLPDEEISIQVPMRSLHQVGMSLNQISAIVRKHSFDAPSGVAGRDDAARQLRFIEQQRDVISFERVPVVADSDGRLITLDEIATIVKRPKKDQILMSHDGKPAIELFLKRQESGNTLKSSETLYEWLDDVKDGLPPGVELIVYDDNSVALRGRIEILVNNGALGLVLVLCVLFLFLNVRVALWVAAGIPVSLLGALAMLYATGGSLNMITLFAFIMTIGIIVDDAIVVGDDALKRFNANASPEEAACLAARRLFVPIFAASLTTIFAFTPTLVIPGAVGKIIAALATVVICVVTISVIEAFLILPGHLRHSFTKMKRAADSRFYATVHRVTSVIEDVWYRRALAAAIKRPLLTISIGFFSLILTAGLFSSGRLTYSFFPTPELNLVFTNVTFVAGTPREHVDAFLDHVSEALLETEEELGGDLLTVTVVRHGTITTDDLFWSPVGNRYGSVIAELIPSDERAVRTRQFLRVWESKISQVPGIELLTVTTSRIGPPGSDIEINLNGPQHNTREASLALTDHLRTIPGIYGVHNNTSYGKQQQVMSLTSLGQALGLTVEDVSRQVSASIAGQELQSHVTEFSEIDVNVSLPDDEQDHLSTIENLRIRLASGESVPLLDVVNVEFNKGFDVLHHADGDFTIQVVADVDDNINNANSVIAALAADVLPGLEREFDVAWQHGRNKIEETEMEQAMKVGALIALSLIYLTLAWVFGSYSWPIFVMLAIPFGMVGAAWGHFALGLTVSILSIFGVIGLSGIVVNNSIVLITYYKNNRELGQSPNDAMVAAGCARLRAVSLSSVTTIVGLLPLLFERSTQAQFLIPMAAAITFGLMFSAILVLFFVPAMLTLFDNIRANLSSKSAPRPEPEPALPHE